MNRRPKRFQKTTIFGVGSLASILLLLSVGLFLPKVARADIDGVCVKFCDSPAPRRTSSGSSSGGNTYRAPPPVQNIPENDPDWPKQSKLLEERKRLEQQASFAVQNEVDQVEADRNAKEAAIRLQKENEALSRQQNDRARLDKEEAELKALIEAKRQETEERNQSAIVASLEEAMAELKPAYVELTAFDPNAEYESCSKGFKFDGNQCVQSDEERLWDLIKGEDIAAIEDIVCVYPDPCDLPSIEQDVEARLAELTPEETINYYNKIDEFHEGIKARQEDLLKEGVALKARLSDASDNPISREEFEKEDAKLERNWNALDDLKKDVAAFEDAMKKEMVTRGFVFSGDGPVLGDIQEDETLKDPDEPKQVSSAATN